MSKIKALLAGNTSQLAQWTRQPEARWIGICVLIFVGGCALYGLTFGLWRSEVQGICTAIKFPAVVILTCLGNAVLNGFLAMVMGAGLNFRQSGVAMVFSFTIMGLILASLAPLMLFLLWNTPGPDHTGAARGNSVILLAHVGAIAFAGVVANHRLWRLLRAVSGSNQKAHTVLFAWLAGNLLLGSQISWILRPWVGRPGSPVTFFSPEPFQGNFFEAVWHAIQVLITK